MESVLYTKLNKNDNYIYLVIDGKRYKTNNVLFEEHVKEVFGESAKWQLSKDKHSICYEF